MVKIIYMMFKILSISSVIKYEYRRPKDYGLTQNDENMRCCYNETSNNYPFAAALILYLS